MSRILLACGILAAHFSLNVAAQSKGSPDWLIDPSPYRAQVLTNANGRELKLSNGLLARTFRLTPNAATVGLDNLITGEALLRGVKPEATLEIDANVTKSAD